MPAAFAAFSTISEKTFKQSKHAGTIEKVSQITATE
jgi:hypothetical protein